MSGNPSLGSPKLKGRTLYLTELALITAVMIIMAFTPLGYFHTPLLSVTLMTAPVAIGGILFGPFAGAYCGGVFGVTSVINAVTTGGLTGMLLLINPVGALFTMLIPRILDGYICALIALIFKKMKRKKTGVILASVCCPIFNTIFFMGSLILIFFNTDYIQGIAHSLGTADPFIFIAAYVGVQGLIEAAVCSILASLISLALFHIIKTE